MNGWVDRLGSEHHVLPGGLIRRGIDINGLAWDETFLSLSVLESPHADGDEVLTDESVTTNGQHLAVNAVPNQDHVS